jgi:hypothetical protein
MMKTLLARKRREEKTMTLTSLAISIGQSIRSMMMTSKADQEAARRPIIIMLARAKILILMMDFRL